MINYYSLFDSSMKLFVLFVVLILVAAGAGVLAYYDFGLRNRANNHVYLGAVYQGATERVNEISAVVEFGNGRNLAHSTYYVVLSAWDSNGSYDQVGISSIRGHFFAAYSHTETVSGILNYEYDSEWFPISPGLYTIGLKANRGWVTFSLDSYSITVFTGANYIIVSPYQYVGNRSYTGLSVYEEIYGFNGMLPGISFNFSKIFISSTGIGQGYVDTWSLYDSNIPPNDSLSYRIFIGDGAINIYNVPAFILTIEVNNLLSPAYASVCDIYLSVVNGSLYPIELTRGNYTLFLEYANKDVLRSAYFDINLQAGTLYQINVKANSS